MPPVTVKEVEYDPPTVVPGSGLGVVMTGAALMMKGTPTPRLAPFDGVTMAVPAVVKRLAATVVRVVVLLRNWTGSAVTTPPKVHVSVVPTVCETGSNGRKLVPVRLIVTPLAPAVAAGGVREEITGVCPDRRAAKTAPARKIRLLIRIPGIP